MPRTVPLQARFDLTGVAALDRKIPMHAANCDSAPAPLPEFLTEMVGDVQMRHRTKSQSLLKQLPIKLQELAGISGAGIGDDKADVEIVCSVGESRYESLL